MAKNQNGKTSQSATMTGPSLRVQRANRFIMDDGKFWHATITQIEPQPAPDPTRSPRYRWTLEGPGTVRSWFLHFGTPMELGEAIDEEIELPEDGIEDLQESAGAEVSAQTNTLAKICLLLGLVTEADLLLDNLDDTLDRLDLSAAIGLNVVCQVAKRNTAFINGAMRPCNPYYAPKLETLKLDLS